MRQLRFYEKNPTVHKAVTLLFKFPPDIRTVLAKGFCAIAETEFDAHLIIKDFKRLGAEKVLALYKSQQRRREYDNDPYLSKAMNYLMILNPDQQFFLSVKLLDLIQVVRDFMILCKKHAISIQMSMVEKIASTYVHFGLKEAEDFLLNARTLMERTFVKAEPAQQKAQAPVNNNVAWESISNEGSGMRLRLSTDFS